MDKVPAWERGFKCHGFWLTPTIQIGRVSIGPLNWTPADGYDWLFRLTPSGGYVEGKAKSLRAGKRAVEKLWEAWLATYPDCTAAMIENKTFHSNEYQNGIHGKAAPPPGA